MLTCAKSTLEKVMEGMYNESRKGGVIVPIIYAKLRQKLKEKGITSYTVRKEKIVGQAAWSRLQNDGDLNTSTIATFCGLLDCQPGDLLEYIPDDPAIE